ncbi:xylosyltransferase oxt isoform X2 [Toxorhynchites rutilus septentrionalis]|uniref:xylosyltransferase oxt isoform X2 n=1 Tax=Toxorhynchites rutilus septentrionalis TaxID=329112 RepID=UPI00247A0EAC|nr:xylosyltransferase oxt isoform X2 [Toxorhynchites rutilus septentrionalis]
MLKTLALRCFRRYKVFFLIGLLIVGAQIFLAYKLLKIPVSGTGSDEERDLSKRLYEKYVKKVAGSNLSADDEDPAGNAQQQLSHVAPEKGTGGREIRKESAGRTFLNLNDLDFVPPCDLHSKETISAIHRARSQHCKKQIVDIACAIQSGSFYPQRLPNFCPNGDFVPNRELGCYRDEKNFRILSGYYTNFKTTNSPIKCIQLCLQSGFLYAGVQYSSECFCGDEPPKASAKLPDSSCNMKCTGDPKQACGGYFTTNVYETGIAKFSPQTTEVTPKAGKEPVRIAFLLTLNGRALRQVHRLLKTLYSTRHYYFIHVDERQEYLYRELLKLEPFFPNIRVSRNRWSTIWGGASLLQMLLSSMEHLLKETPDWEWDFVMNLSESDFPVKTLDKLVRFLSANRGKNFVRSHGREVQRFIQKQGLDRTFVECDNHMWRIGDRVLPSGVQIDGGSDWICLSRDFTQYVTEGRVGDELVEGLLIIFRQTILPAESFFHTVLRNSKFCNSYVDNNLHVTNWKRRLGCKCQYKQIVDWCGCSPNDFKPEDWVKLYGTESKQFYFARKFEPIINQEVILQLEEWVHGPYPADYPNLHLYWQNFYHLEDKSTPTDGALLNVVYSILRLIANGEQKQFQEPFRIRELNHFLDYDRYKGFLILYDVAIDGQNCLLETRVQPNNTAQVSKSAPLGRRLTQLEVSGDFDQKEQVSRNFQRTIGTNSDLVLIFRLAGSRANKNVTSYTLTILWMDPRGILADSSELTIEDNPSGPLENLIHFSKAGNLKQPLLTGVWTAKLVHRKVLLGVTRFLVVSSLPLAGTNQTTKEQEQEQLDSYSYFTDSSREQSSSFKSTCHPR